MKKLLVCLFTVPLFTGCMLAEKGVRLSGSVGIEGYSDHTESITVKPDEDPIICKAYRFSFCKGVQANQVQGS